MPLSELTQEERKAVAMVTTRKIKGGHTVMVDRRTFEAVQSALIKYALASAERKANE